MNWRANRAPGNRGSIASYSTAIVEELARRCSRFFLPRDDGRRNSGHAAIADVYIGTRIPAALNEQPEATAQRENNRVSAVIRRLLTAALDREDEARVVQHTRRAKRVS